MVVKNKVKKVKKGKKNKVNKVKKPMKGGVTAQELTAINRVKYLLQHAEDSADHTHLKMTLILEALSTVLNNDLDKYPKIRETLTTKMNELARYNFNQLIDTKNEKSLKKEVRKLTKKLFEEQKKTQKERAKKIIKKHKSRTKNLACKNEIDYILQERIEDIPSEDLVYIKLKTHIYCFDKDSFKGMITYSKAQRVKGNCKPAIPGQPLECEWFYPINLGYNVFIDEKNYNKIKVMKDAKWILKNKRIVNFTTGLHVISEKSGMDDVYDLVPGKYTVGKTVSKTVSTKDKCIQMTLSELRKTTAYKNLPRSAGKSKLTKKELCKLLGDS